MFANAVFNALQQHARLYPWQYCDVSLPNVTVHCRVAVWRARDFKMLLYVNAIYDRCVPYCHAYYQHYLHASPSRRADMKLLTIAKCSVDGTRWWISEWYFPLSWSDVVQVWVVLIDSWFSLRTLHCRYTALWMCTNSISCQSGFVCLHPSPYLNIGRLDLGFLRLLSSDHARQRVHVWHS